MNNYNLFENLNQKSIDEVIKNLSKDGNLNFLKIIEELSLEDKKKIEENRSTLMLIIGFFNKNENYKKTENLQLNTYEWLMKNFQIKEDMFFDMFPSVFNKAPKSFFKSLNCYLDKRIDIYGLYDIKMLFLNNSFDELIKNPITEEILVKVNKLIISLCKSTKEIGFEVFSFLENSNFYKLNNFYNQNIYELFNLELCWENHSELMLKQIVLNDFFEDFFNELSKEKQEYLVKKCFVNSPNYFDISKNEIAGNLYDLLEDKNLEDKKKIMMFFYSLPNNIKREIFLDTKISCLLKKEKEHLFRGDNLMMKELEAIDNEFDLKEINVAKINKKITM